MTTPNYRNRDRESDCNRASSWAGSLKLRSLGAIHSTMKHHALLLIISFAALGSVQGGKPYPKYQPPPANRPLAAGALPSSVLQPFLDSRLNIILAPLAGPGLKHPEAVADLRSAITDGMSKAPATQQPAFQAAISLCSVLSQAVDERQRATANLEGSQRPSSWPGTKHPAAREAAQNNAFFANAQKTQWEQRAVQLRHQIEQLYAREREIERQVTATPGT